VQPERSPDWRAHLLGEIPAAVALFDVDCRYLAASAPWLEAFALSADVLVGYRHEELGKLGSKALAEAQRLALSGVAVDRYEAAESDETSSWRPAFSARPHRNIDGLITGVIVALHYGGTTSENDAEAPADSLTGLIGRDGFMRRLRQLLREPISGDRAVTVYAINIDRFRYINNLHGSRVGDRVLRVVAERLVAGTRGHRRPQIDAGSDFARRDDWVARIGADEFAVVLGPPALSSVQARALAERLVAIVQQPIAVGDLTLRLTAGVGYLATTVAHTDENDAMRDLDLAVRRAKLLGPGRANAWEPSLTRAATHRYALAGQLRRAVEDREFVLHYQPVVRLIDRRMMGAEALLRWHRPSEGLLPPASFLAALEESGLIVEVGCWAIREAARQIDAWQALYGREMIDWVSVNVSPRQFDDAGPLLTTLGELHDSGFSLTRLKLEITETTFMRNPEATRVVLAEIRQLGGRVGIDDFGTGYSSLGALRRYPVDTIKIDGEFIAQIGTAQGDELTGAILNIAHLYGTSVVAEGIETPEQLDFLRQRGCSLGQGFLLGPPMESRLLGNFALASRSGGITPRSGTVAG
jgi:diguanylate cyclase